MSTAPRILLSGYYGYDNAGDEAILQATVDGIRRRMPGADLTVLTAQPERLEVQLGVRCVDRYNPRAFWPYFRRNAVFVSGGGGLFQDVTGRFTLWYYLGLILLARLRGMKTMVYAQSLGPLRRRRSRQAVSILLSGVDRITFRDPGSAALLEALGVDRPAQVTADPAFALEKAPEARLAQILQDEGIDPARPVLAIAVRPWADYPERGRRDLAAALESAAGDRHLVFLNLHSRDDPAASAELAGWIGRPSTVLKGSYSPSELAGIIGRAEALVAMRLHAIIFAALSGVPAAALSYDPKVEALALQLGRPLPIDVRTATRESTETALREALATGPEERARLRAAAASQRLRSEENFRVMEELALGAPLRGPVSTPASETRS